MDLTQLANLGEFIGGVAVLVTLVYLARQVRQGTRAAQQAAYNSDSRQLQDLGVAVAQNKSFARIFRLMIEGETSTLDADETTQLYAMVNAAMYSYEATFQSYRDGLIRREQWEGSVDDSLFFLSCPTFLDIARGRRSDLANATLAAIEDRARRHGMLPRHEESTA